MNFFTMNPNLKIKNKNRKIIGGTGGGGGGE